MLSDNSYDIVTVLHHLSKLNNFLKKHACGEAESVNQPLCANAFKELQVDLEKYIEKMRLAIEGLSKEGKFQ